MFRTKVIATTQNLTFTRNVAMKGDVNLSSRRVMRKIRLGKARPAIFYQFDTLVELSDGSVIKRRSQAPKDEIRMITDQRNSALWNPNRSDLSTSDPNATGKINKFKQRFASFSGEEEPVVANEEEAPKDKQDDLLELMGHNVQEVNKGGKLFNKKESRNRKV
ncbi:predicted protein [Scheffersomyces stipitis CBS 6054]|uniref:Ribosomal protein bL31m N-terminal domain-containing protein n=1 Tax=Scheffersomyces stipitis (strain ATCC 58785 / CBS 6054 / NBRC 10063 / NRRL Y-11545) TaxID=322104 RepID=A3LZ91_PICST|nr:mitochondrial 54S ribosomal protein YmL36 [Scheffersomyces stipitis CBS 6054]ABN68117.1 predicted protein [Scheffersomyces stipitis CBS 6054]KAG2734619.1 hypothetical protein G9P44_002625 [Scheffersomyces stipitis]